MPGDTTCVVFWVTCHPSYFYYVPVFLVVSCVSVFLSITYLLMPDETVNKTWRKKVGETLDNLFVEEVSKLFVKMINFKLIMLDLAYSQLYKTSALSSINKSVPHIHQFQQLFFHVYISSVYLFLCVSHRWYVSYRITGSVNSKFADGKR